MTAANSQPSEPRPSGSGSNAADPKQPWWRRRRALAAAVLAVALAYPLSLWPACWVILRLDWERDQDEVALIVRAYAPLLRVLAESPRPIRHAIFWTIELGAPRDGSFLRTRDHVVVWVNRDYGLTLISYP
jgi:hypothetical protein